MRSLSSGVTGHVHMSMHWYFVGARRWLPLRGLTPYPHERQPYDTLGTCRMHEEGNLVTAGVISPHLERCSNAAFDLCSH